MQGRFVSLALCALLIGCGGGRESELDLRSDDVAEVKAERALSDYLHDLSPVLEGVTSANARLEHYRVPTSDGTVLDSWIRRPPGESDQPLVLVVTPYYGGGSPDFAGNVLGEPSAAVARFLIPRGYAVGFLSVAGTGNSSGCFHDGGPIERQQLYDAIEYLAEQPWSNGAVGTIGVSYDGTTSNELFVHPPPSLKTVVPIEAITDYYRYSFVNGITREDTTFFTTYYYGIVGLGPVGLSGGVGPSEPADFVQELAGEVCPEQLDYQQESVNGGLTGNKTAHWDERDAVALIEDSLDLPRPSMFYIQGYQDANVDPGMANGFLDAVAATGVPLKIWFGQWVHAWPQPTSGACAASGPCRGDFFEVALLAWFDQFLKGRETGILDAPPVQTQGDDGIWRHQDVWPSEDLDVVAWGLQDTGAMGPDSGSGTAAYYDQTGARPENALGEAQQDIIGAHAMLPFVADDPVEFVSEPLAQSLRLTGHPRLTITVTAQDVRANLVATLFAEDETGARRYLNFSALSLNHAVNLAEADPDITGKALALTLEFYPQDNIVPAGSRLVLHIGGDVPGSDVQLGNASNFLNTGPSLLPVGIGAEVILDLASASFELPVNRGDRQEPLSWLR